MRAAHIVANGTTNLPVTPKLLLCRKQQVTGSASDMEFDMPDDQGNSTPFEQAGTLTVSEKK